MIYSIYLMKRILEDLLIYPFVFAGRFVSGTFEKEFDIIFFIPFYHIGGAERIHLEVTRSFRDKRCLIIFTKKSSGIGYLEEFQELGFDIWEVSARTDNKWKYWENLIYRGIVSGKIARMKRKPIVFNGQSNFGYKVSRWLPKSVRQIELLHSYCSFSQIRLPFLEYYESTCMIGKRKINEHLRQYRRIGVPSKYDQRIIHTANAIQLPMGVLMPKKLGHQIEFVFVGRNSPEKRVGLAIEIVSTLRSRGLDVTLLLVGDFKKEIPTEFSDFISCSGPISDLETLYQIYKSKGHFIFVTSSDESGPLVLMEGMSHGMLAISTDVGEVNAHVTSGENGLLFPPTWEADQAAESILSFVQHLLAHPGLYQRFSQNNIWYAKANFGLSRLQNDYRRVLLQKVS